MSAVALAMPDDEPVVWVLHDGKPGMVSQSLGLAEATGFGLVEKQLRIRFPWARLTPGLWFAPLAALAPSGARLEPPWPDLVVGCGRNTVMPALFVRRESGGRALAAQIQDPRFGRHEFDLIVAPEHDGLSGDNVTLTRGAVHRVTPQRLAAERCRFPQLAAMPRPVITVLIGGNNRAYRLPPQRLGEIAEALARLLRESGGSALVTPSRRTEERGFALLRDRLQGLPAAIWDGTGANPYFAYLAFADACLVTADSVSMISEAAATGKPVHILELPGGNGKFARFHQRMQADGITRPFAGRLESWSYRVPDDTARAGARLRALVLERRERRVPA
jgi:mitochondrial fission protein ELM1